MVGAPGPIRIGDLEVEVVPDGVAAYGVEDVFPGIDPGVLERVLDGRLANDGSLPLPYNPLLVRSRGELILVDAGAGEDAAEDWGDPVGRTEASLRAVGVEPADVDTVLITHAHADHVGGLTILADGERAPLYRNARHVMSRREWSFWVEGEHERRMYAWLAGLARTHLVPLRDRGLLDLVEGVEEVAPGIRVIETPGHTPGHLAYVLDSGSTEVIAAGDAVLHEWALGHPDWTAATEWDPELVVETRRRLLERAAATGSVVHGFHLPSIGRIVADGDVYRLEVP